MNKSNIMSQCVVPSWNVRQQRQVLDQQDANEGNNKSSHVNFDSHHHQHHHFHNLHNLSQIVPMSNTEVTELTWENGQLAMHELGGILAPSSTTSSPPKPTWAGGTRSANETLESIVRQATHCNKQGSNLMPANQQQTGQNMERVGSVVASSGGKLTENSGPMQTHGPPHTPVLVKKRTRSESEHCGRNKLGITNMPNDQESTGASTNSEFCRDNNDTTIVTWNSFESPLSCTKTKITTDEDSACHGGSEEERETKGETGRSYPTRKGRAAAVHNQSERRRRERINQKMKALQKLVPNANKTDKASMLDEVIEYLKHLQAQVQMMSNARFMPQIMMPLGMQQHVHQMSLLARMGMGAGLGMGIGMGMLDTTNTNQTIPQSIHQLLHPTQDSSVFVPPAFVVPQMITTAQQSNPDSGATTSATMQDPYSTLLAQSMNMELYNRMATLQRQQQAQIQSKNNQMLFRSNVQGG